MIELAALHLVTLHMVDGRTALINPAQVTQLLQPREPDHPGKQISIKVKCLLRFTDGGYLSVAETCFEVYKMLEDVP